MDFERIYALDKFFSSRRYPVPLNDILNEFEFSVKRQIDNEYLGSGF